MISRFLTICVILCVVGCQDRSIVPADNQLESAGILSPEQLEMIHQHLDSFPNKTEVSMAFIQHGEVSYYGIIRTDDELRTNIQPQAVYEIGSISKVFTSTLLAHYVVDGKLNLSDHINEHLDVPLNHGIQITFEELANHTSGLPRMPSNFIIGSLLNRDNPYKSYDEEKLEAYITQKLKVKVREKKKSSYSNLGVGLLGYTLKKYSGKDYQTMLEEMVFSKYGMHHSTTIREHVGESLVKGLNKDGEETANWDLSSLIAAGGILSNVEDLSKFALAQCDSNNRELALTRIPTYVDSSSLDVGLGWHIIHSKAGHTWYWHNGGTGGYTSSMDIDTDHQHGVIILSNISAFHDDARKIDRLCHGLMKSLYTSGSGE